MKKSRKELIKSKIITDFSIFIKEGLIHSFSYNKMEKSLHDLFNKYNLDYDIILNNNLTVKLYLSNNDRLFTDLEKLQNVSGYYISNWKDSYSEYKTELLTREKFRNLNYIEIIFNKRYDFVDDSINIYLYHVCEESKINKILEKGLIPKSNNIIEWHPERIYLFDNIKGCENFIKERNKIKKSNYKILKIDLRLIDKIKLYKDPKYNDKYGALYTYDNIDPISITKIN